jgi:hypothetical protein
MDQSDQRFSCNIRTVPLKGEVEGQSHDKNCRIVMRQIPHRDEGYEPEELDEDAEIIKEDGLEDEAHKCKSISNIPTAILGANHVGQQISSSVHDDDQSIEYNSIEEKNQIDRIIPNAWDSSPSTVDYNEDPDYESLQKIKEQVFHTDDNSIISRYQDIDEDENDSDMELTQRSRQIQLDLRLREMTELALEAERAAAAGEEIFRGNATKFELGRGLDVDLPLSASPTKALTTPKANDLDSNRGPEPKSRNWNSRCDPFICGSSSSIEPWMCQGKRDNVPHEFKSSPFRNRSVPSKLYHSPRTTSVSSMTSHFPNSIKSHKPPTTSVQKIDKIHILNLRHIDDVIPNFKDMQPFMKMHLTRAGVEEIRDNTTKNDKRVNSSKSHHSTPVHVSGFQQILRSFSSSSYTQKHISRDDDEHSVEDEQTHCTSSESQHDYEHSDRSNPDRPQISDTNSSQQLYVDALANEKCKMKVKLRNPSPLPLPPYSDDVSDGPDVIYVRTASSPWLKFLSNMTPVRRSSLEASPNRTLNVTENISSKSIVLTPSFRTNRKRFHSTTAVKMRSNELPLFQFDNIEAQNDEDNDEVKLSTNSFSSRIRRKSLSDFHPFEIASVGLNVDDQESLHRIVTDAGTSPIKDAVNESCAILASKDNKSHHSEIPGHIHEIGQVSHQPQISANTDLVDNQDKAFTQFDSNIVLRENVLNEKPQQQILSEEPMSDHDSIIVENHSADIPVKGNKNEDDLSFLHDRDQLSSPKDTKTKNSTPISLLLNINAEDGPSSYEMYEKMVEKKELPSSSHRSTPLTKSLSIINLMVEKVPSVIERLNPLRKSKLSKYKDDVSFVENFMYVGVKQKYPRADTKPVKQDQKKNFNHRSEIGCFDFSCKFMIESLNCLHRDESEAPTIDPSASFVEPTSKFGNIQTADSRKKLLIGNRMFQPPSLKLHQSRNKLTDISEDADTVQDEGSLDSM